MLRSSSARSAWDEPPKFRWAVASLRGGLSEARRTAQWRACARCGRAVASRRYRGRAKRCAYTGGEPARAHLVRLPPRGWAVSLRLEQVGARSAWRCEQVQALRPPTWYGQAQGNAVSLRAQYVGARSAWRCKTVQALRMPGNC